MAGASAIRRVILRNGWRAMETTVVPWHAIAALLIVLLSGKEADWALCAVAGSFQQQ